MALDLLTPLDFESQTDGAAVTVLPTGWTMSGTGGTQRASTTAASHGGLGWKIDGFASSFRRLQAAFTAVNVVVLSTYVKFDALVANSYLFAANFNGTGFSDVRWNANGTLTIRNAGVAATNGVSAATMTTGVTYRLEWLLDLTGHVQEVRWYLGDSTTIAGQIGAGGTCPQPATQMNGLYVGLTSAANGFAGNFDSIRVTDTWAGPWVPLAPPATYHVSLTTPAYVNHRALVPGPENTLEGFKLGDTLSPGSYMDVDMLKCADGWVLCHNTTIDGLTHDSSPYSTGNVSSFTLAQWATIRFKNNANTGWAYGTNLTELAAYYGPGGPKAGKVMFLEVKTTSPYAEGIAAIIASGLAPQVIFTSFSRPAVQSAAAQGFTTQFATTTPVFSEMVSDGVSVLCINKDSLTQQIITDAHAVGIKVATFDVIQSSERTSLLAQGVDFIITSAAPTLNPAITVSSSYLVGRLPSPFIA